MKVSKLFAVAIVLTIASIAYWTAYAFNAFYTFHEYNDLGIFADNMWYDIHFPGIMHGLQLLVFGNHIAPDLLVLILPLYYLDQSPLTLLFIQAVVLSCTALVVYFVANDLLKDEKLAFLVFLAFLLNPGMHGMLVFDYHAESLIILFYVLTFYFFMKSRTKPFIMALLLLLGTIEEAPFLAIALMLALALYTVSYEGKEHKKKKLELAILGIFIAAAVFAVYHVITADLVGSYAISYASMPPLFRANLYFAPLLGSASIGIGRVGSIISEFMAFGGMYVVYAILVAFFFLGVALLFDPLISLIAASPWLVEAFVNGNFNFLTMWNQYFSFVLGGTLSAGILGLMLMKERKGVLAKIISRYKHDPEEYERFTRKLATWSIGIMVLVLVVTGPFFVYSKNVNNLSQDFLFQVSPFQRAIDEQLYSVMALVPQNSSLMTDYFIMPHFTHMKYLEEFSNNTLYFTPEFILFDFNLNISLNAYSSVPFLQQYLQSHKYAIYARNGTAYLLVYAGNVTNANAST